MRKLGLTLAIVLAIAAGHADASTRRGPYLQRNTNLYVVSRSGDSIRQITHDRRDHVPAVWSPDGRLIADVVQIGGHDKVEVLTPRGRVLRRFDAGQASGTAPAWSPDGESIAYLRSYHDAERGADDGELVVRPSAGGPTRVVTRLATDQPVWSPNGRSLLYVRGDLVADERPLRPSLWKVRLDGSHDHRLVPGEVVDSPAISRDGKRIAYVRERRRGSELWVADSDGQHRRRLVHAGYVEAAVFAPRGRGIWAYVDNHSLLFESSGTRRALPDWATDWSTDGRLLAGDRGTRVATVRPDGSGLRVLFRFRLRQRGSVHRFPACAGVEWSPHGRRLLVACGYETPD